MLKNCCFGVALLLMSFASAKAVAAPQAEAIPFWNDFEANSGLKLDHSNWQELLDTYVRVNDPSGVHRFDYDSVTPEDQRKLRDYLNYLQKLDPRQLTKARQKAYWLNLYNATIVLIVVVSKPQKTIRSVDRDRLWIAQRFNITLQSLSFNNIEHGVLRPLFNDARIHFALNRATLGSGNISPLAYTAENVEQQLEDAARAFLAHPRALSFAKDDLVLSRMFKWYESDFGENLQELKNYLKRYVSPEVARKLDLTTDVRYQYDWSLNKP